MDFEEDIMSFFRGAVGSNGGKNDYTPADELDDIYKEYTDYVAELKAKGYKVMRNENGKHRVIK